MDGSDPSFKITFQILRKLDSLSPITFTWVANPVQIQPLGPVHLLVHMQRKPRRLLHQEHDRIIMKCWTFCWDNPKTKVFVFNHGWAACPV